MSLPNGKASVDASVSATKAKSGKATGQSPKLLLNREISPRKAHPYRLKDELELYEQEDALAAGQAKEERRQVKRAACWAAVEADDEGDPDEDDPDDAYAEEIRSLYEEDDPEGSPSRQDDEPGLEVWYKRIWSAATGAEKKQLNAMKREQAPAASCYQVLLLRAGLSTKIRELQADLGSNDSDDLDGANEEMSKLLGAQEWLNGWIEGHRPELDDANLIRRLSEHRTAGLGELAELDEKYGIDGPLEVGDEMESLSCAGGSKGKQIPKGVSNTSNVPASFFSKEYKGRTVVVFEWVRKLIKKRMRDRNLPPQAYKSVGNLHDLMSQLLYWLEPQDKHGTPRASESNRLFRDGFWWVAFRPHRLSKQTEMSRTSVHSATKRLEDYGLAARCHDKKSNKWYIRVRFESFVDEVEDLTKSYRRKGTKAL
jgi:hypothetical protein